MGKYVLLMNKGGTAKTTLSSFFGWKGLFIFLEGDWNHENYEHAFGL